VFIRSTLEKKEGLMPAKIIVTGRTTRDIEKSSDKSPYKFGVAVDGLVKKEGEYETKFYNCVVWDRKSDGTGGTPALDLITRMSNRDKTVTKGSMVEVTGTPYYEVVKNEDGNITTYDGIRVTDIEFISVGQKGEQSDSSKTSTSGSNEGNLELEDDEDIPLL
jgi:single-stranded DNA-binding protein